MDNIIASVTNQNLTLPTADKIVSGQIVEVPDILSTLAKGDNLILKFFNNTNLSEIGNTLSVDLNVNGQTVPVDIKLDTSLKLAPQQLHQLVARVVANSIETEAAAPRIQFQLVSVDNQRPENFVTNVSVKNIQPSPSAPSLPLGAEKPVIADVNNAAAQIKLVPQKLNTVLAQPLGELSLPVAVKSQINTFFDKINIGFEVKNINPEQSKIQVEQQIAAFNFPEAVRQALLPLQTADNAEIPQLLNNLKQLLTTLPQVEVPAFAEAKGSVVVLSTPLGTVLPEAALKIKPDTAVVLQLKPDLNLPDRLLSVYETLAKADTPQTSAPLAALPEKFAALFEKLNPLPGLKPEMIEKALLSGIAARAEAARPASPAVAEKASGIFEILAKVNNAVLSEKIQGKIPLPNAKLLSNIVGFNRAAEKGDISAWLGRELVAELKTMGSKGTETLHQLTQFVTSAVKENVAWRTVEVPFFDGSQLGQIAVSVKKPDPDEEKENQQQRSKNGRRFLVDTDFSKLGKFQFDGFASAAERRFDLVIRTSRKLDSDFCSEIMNLFKTSLYNVGYIGTVKINQREKFINIHETSAGKLTDGIYI